MSYLYSMTGFGSKAVHHGDKVIQVELRSLNGKQTDVRCRLPQIFRDKEIDVRKLVLKKALRGKFDLSVSILTDGIEDELVLNTNLASKYIKALTALAEQNNISSDHIMNSLINIPNVLGESKGTIDEEEWMVVKNTIESTCEMLMEFRKREGDTLKKDLLERTAEILNLLSKVSGLETARSEKLKLKIRKSISEQSKFDKIDENRLEQEYIYYLEKLDITEEKIRLKEHCEYFTSFINSVEEEKGRKLSFITQEMGREINTLGSKAQDAELQHIVVEMKDQLEKIKEQCLNIL